MCWMHFLPHEAFVKLDFKYLRTCIWKARALLCLFWVYVIFYCLLVLKAQKLSDKGTKNTFLICSGATTVGWLSKKTLAYTCVRLQKHCVKSTIRQTVYKWKKFKAASSFFKREYPAEIIPRAQHVILKDTRKNPHLTGKFVQKSHVLMCKSTKDSKDKKNKTAG